MNNTKYRLSERDLIIMKESFSAGRIYSTRTDNISLDDAHKKLNAKLSKLICNSKTPHTQEEMFNTIDDIIVTARELKENIELTQTKYALLRNQSVTVPEIIDALDNISKEKES